jgi:hypothetical protein
LVEGAAGACAGIGAAVDADAGVGVDTGVMRGGSPAVYLISVGGFAEVSRGGTTEGLGVGTVCT